MAAGIKGDKCYMTTMAAIPISVPLHHQKNKSIDLEI